jgi:phage host-nuclease inhibitor protein Gam
MRQDELFDRLDENLMGESLVDESKEPWFIRDMDAAAWASRKAARLHHNKTDIDAWEAHEIAKVKEAAQIERDRIERDLVFFTNHLGAFLGRLINEGRKAKSLDLPGGRISIRARQPRLEVEDEQAIEWAKQNDPDLVRVKETLDRVALRKSVALEPGGAVIHKATGEVLPFADWSEQDEGVSFTPEVS